MSAAYSRGAIACVGKSEPYEITMFEDLSVPGSNALGGGMKVSETSPVPLMIDQRRLLA